MVEKCDNLEEEDLDEETEDSEELEQDVTEEMIDKKRQVQ